MPKQPFNYRGETETLDAATRASLPGAFVELADGFVHFELAGSTGGEAVVFVAGISAPYWTWDHNFAALANAGFRTLRFDLYGRGYSDRPDVVYDLDLFDRQLDHLLAALGLSHVTLVGLSMGGAIVTTFADRHPERVRRLVLIDPLSSAPPVPAAMRLVFIRGVGERLMNWFGDAILVGGQAKDFSKPELVAEFQEKYRAAMRYRGFKRAILSTIRSLPTWEIAGAYARVGKRDLPILLVWGRADKTLPFDNHRQVQALMPRLEFRAVDGAGHIPHYERPDVVNPVLIEFLRR
jgi:pimeloyl-ACP methyl ester carboxylesterase